ncbi:45713_t:CDS:2, partial [Gigaspora margarita]
TSVGNASLIFDAIISRFYVLQDFGIVLISTEDTRRFTPDQTIRFLDDMIVGFTLLANRGIKKIVLDLSNNGGGFVSIADFIIKLLFPSIAIFPEDIKVTDVTTAFIKAGSNTNDSGGLYDYKTYISTKTNASFNNVDEYIGNNTYIRGGTQ